jgi:BCD family chlorophyll transporter-like MFS transporter
MLLKRIQLGLIHVAVAMTLVPINSTLNRVMIKELALSATLVAVLASLPYFFSPIQVMIGAFADRHPLLGWRRTPYILLGILLCVTGVVLSPIAAFWMAEDFTGGLWLGLLAFGAWGMGYNFSTVSYLSLASELSGEKERGKTIAVMWFMMIVSIIITSVVLSRLVDPYTAQALTRSFWIVGLAAVLLGLIGLLKLEGRTPTPVAGGEERYSWKAILGAILENRQATLFFVYLAVLLTALLGQDILLEPFAGEAFGMPVQETTRITSIWGGFTLIALLAAGALERRVSKLIMAKWGGWGALVGFALIALSGLLPDQGVFYTGVILLGLGTGFSTVSNLSLMLDMTVVGKVGLFVGAWGMSNAVSRLTGSVLSGAIRDVLTRLLADPVLAYVVVFGILTAMLASSLLLLRRVDVTVFRQQGEQPSLGERAALASEV